MLVEVSALKGVEMSVVCFDQESMNVCMQVRWTGDSKWLTIVILGISTVISHVLVSLLVSLVSCLMHAGNGFITDQL